MEREEKQRPLGHLFSEEGMAASRSEHNHYSSIGRVAAAWALVEASIDSESLRLAGVEAEIGVCFTSQIAGIGRKLDAYIALARQRKLPKDLIERFDRFSKRAQALSEKRNRLVHDVWFFNYPEPPERLEATARKLLRLTYIPTTYDDILNVAREIGDLNGEFEVLAQAVRTWPSSLPGK